MKGLDVVMHWATISENKKWSTNNYNFKELVSELDDNDKDIIKSMFRVGDGELSGPAMTLKLYELCSKDNYKHMKLFYESLLYAMNVIVYEEIRHGLVLKELYNAIEEKETFIDNIDSDYILENYIIGKDIWNDPYKALISFLIGEVTNTIIYREAEKQSNHPKLKEIFKNISADEKRHMMAWRDLSRKLCDESLEIKQNYIEAFKASHFVHQAEIGPYYVDGVKETQRFFTLKVVKEIYEKKIELMKSILDELPFDERELLTGHIKHFKDITNESK